MSERKGKKKKRDNGVVVKMSSTAAQRTAVVPIVNADFCTLKVGSCAMDGTAAVAKQRHTSTGGGRGMKRGCNMCAVGEEGEGRELGCWDSGGA